MDRREEATLGGGDFREAVIELYGIASWWAYHARELREAVERWRDDGCPEPDASRASHVAWG
jgi:hypothetical protein